MRLRSLIKSRFSGDLVFLYLGFLANYLFPLATIPFLSRTLGLESWGKLVFVLSFAQLATVILNFGFSLHGSRMIARHRDDSERVSEIHTEITKARLLLVLPAALIFGTACFFVTNLRESPLLAFLSFVNALAMAFSPGWVLQGLDRMRLYSTMDTLTKLLAFIGIFLAIRKPADAWLVIAFQAASASIVTGLSYNSIRGDYPLRFVRDTLVWPVYKKSAALFFFSLSASIVNQTNAAVLGLFVGTREVAIYSGAEKIVRAAGGLVGPFASAIHAKINYRLAKDPQAAYVIFLRSSAVLIIGSIILSFTLAFGSEFIVRIALGDSFAGSARILRVLCWLLIAHWLASNINLNCLIALHLDAALTKCVMVAAAVSIAGSVALCPTMGSMGMAWAVVASEFALVIALLLTVLSGRKNPFLTGVRTTNENDTVD